VHLHLWISTVHEEPQSGRREQGPVEKRTAKMQDPDSLTQYSVVSGIVRFRVTTFSLDPGPQPTMHSLLRRAGCGAVRAAPLRRACLSTISVRPSLFQVPRSTPAVPSALEPTPVSPWGSGFAAAAARAPVQPDGRRPFVPRPHLASGAAPNTPPPSYEQMYNSFRWPIPEYYNIGVDVCDKHCAAGYGHETALIYDGMKTERERAIQNEATNM
jgi:hypothetical protein